MTNEVSADVSIVSQMRCQIRLTTRTSSIIIVAIVVTLGMFACYWSLKSLLTRSRFVIKQQPRVVVVLTTNRRTSVKSRIDKMLNTFAIATSISLKSTRWYSDK